MNVRWLAQRFLAEWKIKLFLGGAIAAAFWYGYFFLQRHISSPVTVMPQFALDQVVPFRPGAAFFYVSQFFTMPMVIWMMTTRRELTRCARGLGLLIGCSFAAFYFWPTAVARPEVTSGHLFFYDLVRQYDLPGNACPSLHAAFGVFAMGCALEVFGSRPNGKWLIGAFWLWTAVVLASTLLTKQHVFIDLAAGCLLGTASWWFARFKGAGEDERTL